MRAPGCSKKSQRNKYNYDYDVLYYDIECLSGDGKFAGIDNLTTIITHISFYHNDQKYLYILDYLRPIDDDLDDAII